MFVVVQMKKGGQLRGYGVCVSLWPLSKKGEDFAKDVFSNLVISESAMKVNWLEFLSKFSNKLLELE